jgi:ribose transport system substrate-binding protein
MRPMHTLARWTALTAMAAAVLGAAIAPAAAARQRSGVKPPTIALVTINFQALFFQRMNAGAQAAAKAVGAKLVIYNANNSPQAQNSAIEDYVAQHVNAIIVDAIDVHGILPAIRDAANHGIPVVAVDAETRGPGVRTWVGVGNWQGGYALGRFVDTYVKQHMGGKAEVGIVGALNSFIQIQRQNGFEKALSLVPGIKVVQVVDGKNQQEVALTAAEDLLTGNPELNLIYATGEPALIGAVAAVKAHGATGQVKVFGWDLSPESVAGIRQGWVVAVVEQDPYAEGEISVRDCIRLLHHQRVPSQDILPLAIVTRANLNQFTNKLY